MTKILIITLLLLALVAAYAVDTSPVSTEQNGTSQFMIGTLRGDGTLVPFAQYGNGGWWNPWPKPHQMAESIYAESPGVINHSLADLSEPWFKQCGQIPAQWFFWSAGTFTALRASQVVKVTAHSGTNWGLSTDFPKRTSEDSLHDIIGVAVTVRQKIDPFIQIEPASTQGKEISSFIKQIFDAEETTEIDRIRGEGPSAIANLPSLVFSLSSEERVKIETSLTLLYRSSFVVNGEYVYYFEAEKQYQKRTTSGGPACNDVSLFQGWISKDEREGVGLMAANFVFTDCDRKGPSTMIPMGLMTLKDQVFLFVREHGWEDESYTILELNQSGLHRVLMTGGA